MVWYCKDDMILYTEHKLLGFCFHTFTPKERSWSLCLKKDFAFTHSHQRRDHDHSVSKRVWIESKETVLPLTFHQLVGLKERVLYSKSHLLLLTGVLNSKSHLLPLTVECGRLKTILPLTFHQLVGLKRVLHSKPHLLLLTGVLHSKSHLLPLTVECGRPLGLDMWNFHH